MFGAGDSLIVFDREPRIAIESEAQASPVQVSVQTSLLLWGSFAGRMCSHPQEEPSGAPEQAAEDDG